MTLLAVATVACWTNVAGRVLAAAPVSVAGGMASFEIPAANGACVTNSYPLSVFPASEQTRIRATLGLAEPPADAAEANRRAFAAREEERVAAMERDGLISAAEAADRRRKLRGFIDFARRRESPAQESRKATK